MIHQEPFATSTIAMSIYNLLCRLYHRTGDGIAKESEIKTSMILGDFAGMSDKLFRRAIDGLKHRGLIVKYDDDPYGQEFEDIRVADPLAREVFRRNRADIFDPSIDADTGEVLGGWIGWVVRDCDKEVFLDDIVDSVEVSE